MRGFFGDVTLAARRLLATPLFTIFAVLSLAVGVGVTTAVYSVVDAIFLSDPGITDPDRLVFVVMPYDGRLLKGSISEPDFRDLRSAQTSFSSVSAFALFSPAVTSPSTTEPLAAEAVDGAYFSTLGVPAAAGRTIRPSDAAERVVVLSHGLWRDRFSADPAIVGRTVRLSGRPFEVIGIAPASFEVARGAVPGTKLWVASPGDRGVCGSPRGRRTPGSSGAAVGVSDKFLGGVGGALSPEISWIRDHYKRPAERSLGSENFAAACDEGRAMAPPTRLHLRMQGLLGPALREVNSSSSRSMTCRLCPQSVAPARHTQDST